MAEEPGISAGLTLPPKVVGKISGHLVMKVDEVLWARKQPGEVSAVVMWWGSEQPTTFRPIDVAQDASSRRVASVMYEICTSLVLFEKYLRKCGGLEIAVADKYGMPIGCVSISNLWKMISNCPYQGYYPIVNNFGNRIGDLHVSFNLRMLTRPESGTLTVTTTSNNQGIQTKDLKRLKSSRGKQSLAQYGDKEEKMKRNEKALKDALLNQEALLTLRKPMSGNFDRSSVNDHVAVEKTVSPTSNIISQILENGTRLRDAMTASVMEDTLQLNCKSSSEFNVRSSIVDSEINPCQTKSKEALLSFQKLSERDKNLAVNRKVEDYLSGKPMSKIEEQEALAALRSITPTKDILENVVPDTFLKEVFSGMQETDEKNSSEILTNVTYNNNDHVSTGAVCSFDVDSELLSQVNCIRITVHSLVLNSVGIRRIGPASNRKVSASQSNSILHPPGVAYFVEYKFPVTSGSRTWESDVRYCSKRFTDHDVKFGNRTVHNLPPTWRGSVHEETNIGSLISALTFKICARHLHQRVPIFLGTSSPDSVKPLIESAYLRHDYDIPVIAFDRLPVAQLKICIELGRDRIHFGGLFDPDNNSLGIKSPRKISTKSPSLSSTSRKKLGGNVPTVTRNVAAKSSGLHRIPVKQADHANRMIQKLVSNARVPLQLSVSSESSSAPSSARDQMRPSTNISLNQKTFTPELKSSSVKSKIHTLPNCQYLKHEVALTILQVVGKNYLKYSTADDKGFYVTYKFPTVNTMKSDSVDWHSCSTEPSESSDGNWHRPQNRVHSTILPQNESFCDFLHHTFQLGGHFLKTCIFFSLCVRCYGVEVQDLPVAEATLPLSCLSTLVDAYIEAANPQSSSHNPNFSSSSCSTIVLELPLELLPSYRNEESKEQNGSLRLKVDYRHSVVEQPFLKPGLPRSRGDSVTENIPYYDYPHISDFGENMTLKFVPQEKVNMEHCLDSPETVPNWARSLDKKLPPSSRPGVRFHTRENPSPDYYCSANFDRCTNLAAQDMHASWETVQEKRQRIPPLGRLVQDSAYMPKKQEDCKSVTDVIHESREADHTPNVQESKSFINVNSFSSSNLQGSQTNINAEEIKKTDVARSTSPLVSQTSTQSASNTLTLVCNASGIQHKATNSEQIPECHDRFQQTIVDHLDQASQTTPRELKEVISRDVATSANFDQYDLSNMNVIIGTNPPTHCNTSGVETMDSCAEKQSHNVQTSSGNSNVKEDSCEQLSSEISHVDEGTSQASLPEKSAASPSSFTARIGVERALHLQSPQSIGNLKEDEVKSHIFVSLNPCELDGHISPHIGLDLVSVSRAVLYCAEPVWNWQTEVQLPTSLLVSAGKRLLLKVWQYQKGPVDCSLEDLKSASLVGFSVLDLTVLSAGLPSISGWYNIMNFAGKCEGQIEISVEPLEDISKFLKLSSVVFDDSTCTSPSLSVFVAHCAYPEFPSHVTQFPDMRVQKVDPQPPEQAMSCVLNRYQLTLQPSQKSSFGLPASSQQTNHDIDSSSVSLQQKYENTALETSKANARLDGNNSDDTISNDVLKTISNPLPYQNSQGSLNEFLVDVEKDSSDLLREKLSELEILTKAIKSRLITPVEHACASGSSIGLSHSVEEKTQSDYHRVHMHTSDSDKLDISAIDGKKKECKDCACHSNEGGRQAQLRRREESADVCREEVASWHGGQQSSHKQRKTWERQEDLIDLGMLHIDCSEEEQSPQNEDLPDWLSESALQHIFNPFFFNHILNSMNSSQSVQLIELDDSETSDDQDTPSDVPCKPLNMPESGKERSISLKNCKRRSRRGDETYRKETSQFTQNAPKLTNQSYLSACDADSGVDVDVSANFQSGAFFAASGSHVPLVSMTGEGTASTEREESSTCSVSSRNYHSTLPSSASASATPSDSPQHSHPHDRQTESNQSRGILGKRNKSGSIFYSRCN